MVKQPEIAIWPATLSVYCFLSMTVALNLSAGRNLSLRLFFIIDNKAVGCLGVRLS